MNTVSRNLTILLAVILTAAFILCGCSETADSASPDQAAQSVTDNASESEQTQTDTLNYKQVSTDEAIAIMDSESGYIILDVRRQDEYDGGHIPGAICVPNESIGTDEIPQLPDKDQLILVYCRSGRRSKEAAQKLAVMGYTNIVEFGGIIDWTGETVRNQE